MTARMRRLASDWAQVQKDFTAHKNIIVAPVGGQPPEKYHVTYFVNGIYLLPDGSIQTLSRHEVEITLHSDYPRYKPVCRILTPIWHPNFRDGQICIGDIWGAGESLTDIIINIGDMIQYRSWNSFSPLSADAAQWAIKNEHLFPVGNVDLYVADYASAKETVEIDLFDELTEETAPLVEAPTELLEAPTELLDEPTELLREPEEPTVLMPPPPPVVPMPAAKAEDENDFEITAEELAGIEFVPTAQRMHSAAHGGLVKGGRVNFKTILVKGLLWALIGSLVGFFASELTSDVMGSAWVAKMQGYSYLSSYFRYTDQADKAWDAAWSEYEDYCKEEGLDEEDEDAFMAWYLGDMSSQAKKDLEDYQKYSGKADDALYESYEREFDEDEDDLVDAIEGVQRMSTGVWAGVIALFVGLFLGIGEGVFYGSAPKAVRYALIGAVISLVLGTISGYMAQWMYAEMLPDDPEELSAAVIRGLGWALMGLGVGLSAGLIKPETKRILFCSIGGLGGGFIGGFLFIYLYEVIPQDVVARGVAIVIMGVLIGLGVGLLEQFAKQAWLKVIRGEFEGKEYLVFAGTTSIGNNGSNTIVLFKDKLVGPHHCDIKLEGSKYVLIDCGTPMGTVVNGVRTQRHILRRGDAIAVGNSVLVFQTK